MSRAFTCLMVLLLLFGCDHINRKGEEHANTLSTRPEWVQDAVMYEVNMRQYTPEGTIEAFQVHLPRLKNLGVSILCLTSIFPVKKVNLEGSLGNPKAVQNHYQIDPLYGSEKEFQSLVDAAHAEDMKVVIDWVVGYTSLDHPWVSEYPQLYHEAEGTDAVTEISQRNRLSLDYSNADLTDAMIKAMVYWVKTLNIDGFRFDVTADVSDNFWRKAKQEVEKVGEVVFVSNQELDKESSAFQLSHTPGLEARLQQLASGEVDASSIRHYLNENNDMDQVQPIHVNYTSNYAKNALEGTVFDRFGKAAEVFAVLTYVIEGMPMIASGQEVGLAKQLSLYDKDTIPWGDHPFNALYARLGKLKKDNPALWVDGGSMQWLNTNNSQQLVGFSRRSDDGNTVIALLNLSPDKATFRLEDAELSGLYRRFKSRDRFEMTTNSEMTLPPWGYELYIR